MNCVCIVIFLTFCQFACSLPLFNLPIKQDILSGDVQISACSDFLCLTKISHRKRLRVEKESALSKAISTSQSKYEIVDKLRAIQNYVPDRKMQYLHRLMKKSANENVVPNFQHKPENTYLISGKSLKDKSYFDTNKQPKTDIKRPGMHDVDILKTTGSSIFVDSANDAKANADLLNQSKKYLKAKIIEKLKLLYPQPVSGATTRTTTSRGHEDRKTFAERLKELGKMDVNELVNLLHNSLHQLAGAMHNFQTTVTAKIPRLHNICCDIG